MILSDNFQYILCLDLDQSINIFYILSCLFCVSFYLFFIYEFFFCQTHFSLHCCLVISSTFFVTVIWVSACLPLVLVRESGCFVWFCFLIHVAIMLHFLLLLKHFSGEISPYLGLFYLSFQYFAQAYFYETLGNPFLAPV